MKPVQHTSYSLIISGILYFLFHSWELAAACLISGIFIDIDKEVDDDAQANQHAEGDQVPSEKVFGNVTV